MSILITINLPIISQLKFKIEWHGCRQIVRYVELNLNPPTVLFVLSPNKHYSTSTNSLLYSLQGPVSVYKLS